jgi:ornithine decarboxylase
MAHPHRAIYPSAFALASALSPVEPVTLVRPNAAKRAARYFLDTFPGKTLYAVKANPSPDLLLALWDGGITQL